MKNLTSFLLYLAGFIGTTYMIATANWTSAAMFFMLFLNQLVLQITEAIEKKQSC